VTNPVCVDPAEEFITVTMTAMRTLFDPSKTCPPEGGGTTVVHFVGGEGPFWDPLVGDGDQCDEPFLWVRLAGRYRTTAFPEADLVVNPCGGTIVVQLEVGVGRCAQWSLEATTDWTESDKYAEIVRDDSWRLDRVMCGLYGEIKNKAQLAVEPIMSQGPEGGGIITFTNIFIGITH
jgi:hypothetical protein